MSLIGGKEIGADKRILGKRYVNAKKEV